MPEGEQGTDLKRCRPSCDGHAALSAGKVASRTQRVPHTTAACGLAGLQKDAPRTPFTKVNVQT